LDLKEDQLAVLQATKSDSLDSASSTPTIVSPTPNPILETETEAAPEPVASKSKPEPSFVDELLGNPIYWGAAGGVIALAVIALMLRRRKQSEDEDDLDLASTFAEEPELDELSDLPLAEDDLDVSMVTEDEISTESEFELDDASVGDFADDDVVEDDIVEPQAPIQSETGDAIAEADIYIAYGRFQQAMDLLKSAHTQEPQRSDVLVKLLEVCLESRDKPDFQEHYVKLKSLGDEGAIIQVKEMLSTVDGAEDWLDGLPGSAPNITDADMDAELIEGQDESLEGIDSDLDDDLLVANSTLEFDAIDISLDDDGIELDLDLDLEGDDLDELSENRTMQFDTTMLDEKLGDGEPLATSLGLDESSDELSSELSSLDTDSGEIDLGDLELDSLDLEGDFDLDDGLDIDLEDGLDTALESGDTADSDEIMSLDTEEELDLSADLELAVDLESDDLALDSLETAGDLTSEDSLELDLSDDFGDLELSAELEELEPELEESNEEEALDVSLDIAAVSADLEAELDLDGLADLEGEELSLEPDIDAEMEDLETSLSEEALVEDLGDAVAELSTTFIESAEDITEESVDEPASSDVDDDDEFDFLADTDEVATKLDLARAYIDMGDTDGAKDILGEVVLEGSDEQQKEANSLLERV
ncbi:MAG: pilus assembly protein FimV, partial [Pseudohongiellaceae bacterium]